MNFAAIDFETADTGADSACAVGIVRVSRGRIVDRVHRLLRPPRKDFRFTYIHGITWGQVSGSPDFGGAWPELEKLLSDTQFIAAHNAPFDRNVLNACCAAAGIKRPAQPFVCTVKLARKVWGIYPTKLPDVCGRLGIELKHHEALSDAEACARIVMAALRAGAKINPITFVGAKPGNVWDPAFR